MIAEDELRPFRPSVLHAGIEVLRECTGSTRTPEEALHFIRQGSADRTSLDYPTAAAVAQVHGWGVFSAHQDVHVAFRESLHQLVLARRPLWVRLLPSGRGKVVRHLDEDLQQCLGIAGVLGFDDDAVALWDQLAMLGRKWTDEERLAIGRAAERRAMARERALLEGTSLEPVWVAIDDNAAGYDILSWKVDLRSRPVPTKRYVEVKGSSLVGTVHLTRHEWRFAEEHRERWELQVWVDGQNEPTVVGIDSVRPHIAINQGMGRWAEVEIPTEALVPSLGADSTPVPLDTASVPGQPQAV